MKLEHLALNVADPVAMAQWYAEHLDFRIVHKSDSAARTHFLADPAGMMLEIYNNPPDKVPNYAAMDLLILHVAFAADDPPALKAKLLAAGATLIAEQTLPDGTQLLMVRDPWGLALQFCKRAVPFV